MKQIATRKVDCREKNGPLQECKHYLYSDIQYSRKETAAYTDVKLYKSRDC